MQYQWTPFVFLCFLSVQGLAQAPDQLPLFRTPSEKASLLNLGSQPPVAGGITQPPAGPVRLMAEWEETAALALTWRKDTHTDILAEIVRHARTRCTVLLHCSGTAGVENAKSELLRKGIDISSGIVFIPTRSNSIWIRDYGPNSVYLHDVDSLLFTDWIYNRLRVHDDTLAFRTAREWSVPLYVTTTPPYQLVNTGGNVLSDGMGTAFSSKLVLEENAPGSFWLQQAHDEGEIDELMQRFTGINRYLKMDTLPYDNIHHLDMHLRLLDEETFLVGQYPEGVSDGPQIEANLKYLLSQPSAFGHPYRVVRIPMPSWGGQYPPFNYQPLKKYLYPTYTNSLILNDLVFLPVYGTPSDEEAKEIYRQALPGYQIIPIDCKSLIDEGGALHCITKEIGSRDPLRIVHRPVRNLPASDAPEPYPIQALLQHQSGIAAAHLYYSTDSSATEWSSRPMHPAPHPDSLNYWTGYLPADIFSAKAGNTIYYYIEAIARNGKRQVRPYPAPKGWWPLRLARSSAVQDAAPVRLAAPFPNPAHDRVCVPVEVSQRLQGGLLLEDATGHLLEVVYEGPLLPGITRHCVEVERFAPGVYFLVVQAGGKTMARQLFVMK
jgi:agmatine/peptidylarginine deiminase